MERKLTRRDLIKSATAAVLGGATVATAAEKSTNGQMNKGMIDQMDITKDSFPRIEPNRKYSPPPPLMGKQMGRAHTLSQSPLGYEMDGNVKVFHLIAQPVKATITKGTKDTHVSMGKFRPMPMGSMPAEGTFTHLEVSPIGLNYNPKDPNTPCKPPTREVIR